MRLNQSLLFANGTVWSGDPPEPNNTWIMINGGQVQGIGSGPKPSADIEIDLAGKILMPGFVDSHSHLTLGAWIPFAMQGQNWTSKQTLLDHLSRRQVEDASSWLLALGTEFDRLKGGIPSVRELDEATSRPALIMDANYHRALISTAGMARLDLAATTPKRTGDIELRGGRATGMLWDEAAGKALHQALSDLAAQLKDEGVLRLLLTEAERYLSFGITTCHDPLIPPSLQMLMTQFVSRTPLRVSWSHVAEQGLLSPPGVTELCPDCGAGPSSAKLFMDGAHRCALCLDPTHALQMTAVAIYQALLGHAIPLKNILQAPARYLNGKFQTPYLRMESAELVEHLVCHAEAGTRTRIHAFGNRAASCACHALISSGHPDATLEHLMFLRPSEMDLVAETGATASLQPGLLQPLAETVIRGRITPRQHFIPVASLHQRGVQVALSSDHPCGPLDPLENIRMAVTRKLADGTVADSREAVPVDVAVRGYTTQGHRAITGQPGQGLSPGADADFVILNKEILDTSARVLETWIGGQRVWPVPR